MENLLILPAWKWNLDFRSDFLKIYVLWFLNKEEVRSSSHVRKFEKLYQIIGDPPFSKYFNFFEENNHEFKF